MISYIIGFEARKKSNISDCYSPGSNTLCNNGANFIRSNRDHILNQYEITVSELAKVIGRLSRPIFMIEPDYWY